MPSVSGARPLARIRLRSGNRWPVIKMAQVFLVLISTIAIYTGFAPRWIAVLGYILALTLLLGSYYISWIFIIFAAWVLLISLHIVIDNLRQSPQVGASRTITG
jgi:hypothetical protein